MKTVRIRPGAALLCVVFAVVCMPALADTKTWTGASNALWSDSLNWSGGTPAAGDRLVFNAAGANKTMSNDIAAGTSFFDLTFQASGYTINGNGFGVTNGIAGASSVINVPVTVGGNQTIGSVTLSGSLDTAGYDVSLSSSTVSGNISNLSGTMTVQTSSISGNVNMSGTLVFGNSSNSTVSGVISGSGAVRLVNYSGLTVLSGNNTYTGPTTFSSAAYQKQLRIMGLQPNSDVSFDSAISDGSILEGTGTVGNLSVTSPYAYNYLRPGVGGTGIISTRNLSLGSGSALLIELNGPVAGASYDQLAVTGTVTLSGNTTLTPSLGYLPSLGQAFTIVANDLSDAVSGTFNGLPEGAAVASRARSPGELHAG